MKKVDEKLNMLNLSERKKQILRAVVSDYIDDGQPISSKLIQQKYLGEVSTATIRNELSQLEELGYLGQPHTSAGRVPLPAAYRVYVNELMQREDLSDGEIDYIHSRFDSQFKESEYLVKCAAKLISEMTDYTAVGYVENYEDTINTVRLVPLSEQTVLLVVVTDRNVIKDQIISTYFDAEGKSTDIAEQLLNQELGGKKLKELENITVRVSARLSAYRTLFEEILRVLKEHVRGGDERLVLEGSGNIFKHSEFNDIDTTKNFLTVLGSRQKLTKLLGEGSELEICVRIGREGDSELSDDFAMVTANYRLDGKPVGRAGVIGPIRMDYEKVVRVLSLIGKTIDGLSSGKADSPDGGKEE